jgi:hypothetical protein
MNPFDEHGLSPLASIDEITTELRERAGDASDEQRRALRAAWESLTLHPRARLAHALDTFPASSERDPSPPRAGAQGALSPLVFSLLDLLPRPSVEAAFAGAIPSAPSVLPPISEDRLAFGETTHSLSRKRDNT